MKSVFHWTFIACENSARQKNEGAVNLQTQRAEAEDTYSNEIGLTPKKPPMTVVACKFPGEARITVTRKLRISRGHRDPSHHHDRSERIPPTYVRGSPAQSFGERVLR